MFNIVHFVLEGIKVTYVIFGILVKNTLTLEVVWAKNICLNKTYKRVCCNYF